MSKHNKMTHVITVKSCPTQQHKKVFYYLKYKACVCVIELNRFRLVFSMNTYIIEYIYQSLGVNLLLLQLAGSINVVLETSWESWEDKVIEFAILDRNHCLASEFLLPNFPDISYFPKSKWETNSGANYLWTILSAFYPEPPRRIDYVLWKRMLI